MIHIAVRVRELVSSNVDSLVGKASDPAKMLHHLRTEIEESLITLHGDLAKAKRQHERLIEQADAKAEGAEEWTAKAKTAMDHKREDLARSALLARENERVAADKLRSEANELAAGIEQTEDAIEKLGAKRSEAVARAPDLPVTEKNSACPSTDDNTIDRRLDRIERMERRVEFANETREEPVPANIDAEIAALQRDADLTAELAAMKSASKPANGRKRTA